MKVSIEVMKKFGKYPQFDLWLNGVKEEGVKQNSDGFFFINLKAGDRIKFQEGPVFSNELTVDDEQELILKQNEIFKIFAIFSMITILAFAFFFFQPVHFGINMSRIVFPILIFNGMGFAYFYFTNRMYILKEKSE